MTKSRVLMAAAVVAALVATGSAQQGGGAPARDGAANANAQDQGQPARPTFRTDINFVRVDVIVTDKGEPVTNLTQNDFEVREDGKLQTIEQFRLVRVDSTPRAGDPPPRVIRTRDDEEQEAARDDTRVIAIFLDDYHTRRASGIVVQRALADFVQSQLRPTDMVAVMYPLTPVTDLQFTRNRESTLTAIKNFEGRKFRYDVRNEFERQYERQPAEVVENIRNQISMTALSGLATRLGTVREGRKTVIYVSEGFTALLPPQLRTSDASIPAGNIPPGVGENSVNEERARLFAQSDIIMRMRDVFTAFNRNNASIYALDPRGLGATAFDIDENVGPQQDSASMRQTQDTLRMLAKNTDGKAIVSRNDLARGLEQAMRDSSAYYLIGYTTSAPTDGKFHEIKVDVKRRGIEVRGRKGFWAATNEDARAAAAPPSPTTAKPFETALGALATPIRAQQYVRTWVGTARGQNGRTQVTLVVEPVGGPAGARREQVGRVTVLAATANGDVVYRGRTAAPAGVSASPPASSSASGAAAAATAPATPQQVVFDAPPGPMELRLSVEAAEGGVLDNDVKKLTVPDLTRPQLAMSTPRVYRARTARDVQTLARDSAAVPTSVREFSRTEHMLVRFDAYAASGETPMVTAALLNRSGQKMSDVPVTAGTTGTTHQIDLPLASIPPGEYVVEITTKGGGGDDAVKDFVALRVVS